MMTYDELQRLLRLAAEPMPLGLSPATLEQLEAARQQLEQIVFIPVPEPREPYRRMTASEIIHHAEFREQFMRRFDEHSRNTLLYGVDMAFEPRRVEPPKRFSPEFRALLQKRAANLRTEISFDSRQLVEGRANCEHVGHGFAPGWLFAETPKLFKPL